MRPRRATSHLGIVAVLAAAGCVPFPGGDTSHDASNDLAEVTSLATDAATDIVAITVDTPAVTQDAGAVTCVSNATGAPMTFDYVLSAAYLDQASATGMPDFTHGYFGFNVDGVFSGAALPGAPPSGSCNHEDFFSVIDPDQNEDGCVPDGSTECRGGVDNQLPAFRQYLLTTSDEDIQASFMDGIAAGSFILLIRVSNVNGTPGPTMDDCDVTISIFGGHSLAPACNCAAGFSGAGRFAVDDAYVTVPGDLTSARFQFPGQIIHGRLRTSAIPQGSDPVLSYPFPLASTPLPINVHQFQLRMNVTPGGGTVGNLGGYLPQDETYWNAVAALGGPTTHYLPIIGPVIESLVDVATGDPLECGNLAGPDGGPDPNGGIGFGFGFTATSAVIVSGTVSAGNMALNGTCGGPPATDGGSPVDASLPDGC